MTCPPPEFWTTLAGGFAFFLFLAGVALCIWVRKERHDPEPHSTSRMMGEAGHD